MCAIGSLHPGSEGLLEAVRSNRLDVVQRLLEQGAGVDEADTRGQTPLMAAAMLGEIPILKLLLSKGASVTRKDELGDTALIWAAIGGKSKAATALLAAGADPNAEDRNGSTALIRATGGGFAECALALIRGAADVDHVMSSTQTALHFAPNTVLVHILLAAGADVNGKALSGIPRGARLTPLMQAAQAGRLDVVKSLLAAGARSDLRDSQGFTAYDYALINRRSDCAKALESATLLRSEDTIADVLLNTPRLRANSTEIELFGSVESVRESGQIVIDNTGRLGESTGIPFETYPAKTVKLTGLDSSVPIVTRLGDRLSLGSIGKGDWVCAVVPSKGSATDFKPRVVTIARPAFSANSTEPWFQVRLQILRFLDDDGGRGGFDRVQDYRRTISEVNRVYADARVRFIWDPAEDYEEIRSTRMNSLHRASPLADAEVQSIMRRHPGKVQVVFCYGDGDGGQYGGSNGIVLRPLKDKATRSAMLGGMVHELGHFWGLSHTFLNRFDIYSDAAAFLAKHNNDPACFKGDTFADTGTDPGLPFVENWGCNSLKMNGLTLRIPWGNVMSYTFYEGHEWFSPQQIGFIRNKVESFIKSGDAKG